MNLFDTTQRSWRLVKSAMFVIRKHPKLMLFPILIGVFTLVIGAFYMTPVIVMAIHNYHPPGPNAGPFETIAAYPRWVGFYCLLLYPLSMFLATFCNVAFYSQVIGALNGQPVSIRSGLGVAAGRIKSILVWSLFAGVVGAIIREIESRLGFVGRIVAGMIGLAWSVAAVFVIPIIIREENTANPVKILEKSANTIKRTWGEMLTGYAGLGIANVVAFVCALVVFFAAIALAIALSNAWILLPIGVVWLVGILAYGCFSNVASQTYLCALYIYASEGIIPEPYDQELLDRAWKVKKG